jgi:membrane protein DedA with SNARE-associated domain
VAPSLRLQMGDQQRGFQRLSQASNKLKHGPPDSHFGNWRVTGLSRLRVGNRKVREGGAPKPNPSCKRQHRKRQQAVKEISGIAGSVKRGVRIVVEHAFNKSRLWQRFEFATIPRASLERGHGFPAARGPELVDTHQLVQHGYTTLFVAAFIERLGLPLLVTPIVVAAGLLAANGELDLLAVVGVTTLATLLGDGLWFELGRRRGAKVINFLCRISLSKDSCVRRTQALSERHADWSLLYSKWVPGVAHLTPPLAGHSGMRRRWHCWVGSRCALWNGPASERSCWACCRCGCSPS